MTERRGMARQKKRHSVPRRDIVGERMRAKRIGFPEAVLELAKERGVRQGRPKKR